MHDINIKSVVSKLNTNDISGLTSEEVKKRSKLGLNEIEKSKNPSFLVKFFRQFKDALILILLAAAFLSMVVNQDDMIDSIIILAVVILNAFIGASQESKAEKALDEVRKMSSPKAHVIRNGRNYIIDSKEVVVGDLISFMAGDLIPADARIIKCNDLKIDESSLTGESVTVDKRNVVLSSSTPLAERVNMVYATTIVTKGTGVAVVTAIGMDTEVGKIAKLLHENNEDTTPLQIQLNKLGKVLGLICLGICFVVFILELIAGLELLESFNTAITLAVAAIPEGLATVVTIVLALGVQRLVKKNVIIRRLPSVETLGCASYVCSDKTGTLTKNEMTVKQVYNYSLNNTVYVNDSLIDEYKILLAYGTLCSDCKRLENELTYIGDPTEVAIVVANNKYGVSDILNKYKIIHEYPFDSNRKMMSVIIRNKDNYVVITKGAIDSLLKLCPNVNKERVLLANEKMANNALRVIGVAIKQIRDFSSLKNASEVENNLTFVGLIGMMDPPKEGVKEAISLAKKAGVKTVMITGDHLTTATAIGKQLGILENKTQAISGYEIEEMSDIELKNKVTNYSVYARATPSTKVRIVKALKENDMIVAMTGDGVNDAPSLRSADIGCAMGNKGTEVAKSAASLILFDDNYSSIIEAIKEGRGIYNNIRKVVHFLLSSNIGEVLIIALASIISILGVINVPVPLKPIHLLFVNLITDAFPAFALGLDKVNDEVMSKSPRKKEEPLINKGKWFQIVYQGVIIGLLSLSSFLIGNTINYEIGMTMAFVTLSFSQLFHAFNVRNEGTIFNKSLFDNKYLFLSLLFGGIFEVLVINVPFLSSLFSLSPLDINQFLVSIGLAFMIVIIEEFIKELKRLIKSS